MPGFMSPVFWGESNTKAGAGVGMSGFAQEPAPRRGGGTPARPPPAEPDALLAGGGECELV